MLGLSQQNSLGNLKVIENLILKERVDDLQLLSPELIYSTVYAFARAKINSDLLYLLEPHILKNVRKLKPGKVMDIASQYLNLKQGSYEFLQQIVSVASLVSH